MPVNPAIKQAQAQALNGAAAPGAVQKPTFSLAGGSSFGQTTTAGATGGFGTPAPAAGGGFSFGGTTVAGGATTSTGFGGFGSRSTSTTGGTRRKGKR